MENEVLNFELPESLPVVCVCPNPNPFYVRWLNRFGGVDFWMFQLSQTYTRALAGQDDFIPAIFDTFTSRGTNYAIAKDTENKITVGAGLLTKNEWFELSRIPFSPKIQYYNKRLNTWFDVLPQKGDNEMNVFNGLHEIELDFLLPSILLQS